MGHARSVKHGVIAVIGVFADPAITKWIAVEQVAVSRVVGPVDGAQAALRISEPHP